MIFWPLREALEALRAKAKEIALESFRFDILKWAILAPHSSRRGGLKPPAIPDILKDRRRDDTRR